MPSYWKHSKTFFASTVNPVFTSDGFLSADDLSNDLSSDLSNDLSNNLSNDLPKIC